jgi:hypothetical protein
MVAAVARVRRFLAMRPANQPNSSLGSESKFAVQDMFVVSIQKDIFMSNNTMK